MVSSRKWLFSMAFVSCLLLFLVFSEGAIAAPITGEITFAGTFVLQSGSLSSQNFVISSFTVTGFTANGLDGFAGPVTMNGFSNPPGAATPLWSAVNYSFDLESLIYGGVQAGIYKYFGSGTIHGTGLQDTLASWVFFAKSDGTWTLNTTSGSETAVPEPSLILLMGIGIFGVTLGYKRIAK